MMNARKALHGAACALLVACAALAAHPPIRTAADVELAFKSLDRDNDQRISRKEAAKEESLRKRFAGVDSSGDGYLSFEEFRARPSAEPFE